MEQSKKKLTNLTEKRKIRRAQATLRAFSDIFSPNQLSYLAVLGQSKFDETGQIRKLNKELPPELMTYRFLMHPIRLSMMKLLYKSFSLSSAEIKHQLGISWGDYYNHAVALEKRGFLAISDEFQDGTHLKILYLEELGRKEFESLTELLQIFLKDISHDFFYESKESNDLYPNKES